MPIRQKLKQLGSKVISRGMDSLAKRVSNYSQDWSEEQRAAGVVLTGSSRTASEEASQLARTMGYDAEVAADPADGLSRPRAGRTFGARFDHYPILSPEGALPPKGSEAVWSLDCSLEAPIQVGLADYKEALLLAITAVDCPESARLEDQLLELHPVLEPQTIVVFARVGNLASERLYRRIALGPVILSLPHIPMTFLFKLESAEELKYLSLAEGVLDETAPRFGILELLGGQSHVPPDSSGVLEFQTGKTRHKTTANTGYRRQWHTKLSFGSGE